MIFNSSLFNRKPQNIAIKLNSKGEKSVISGHPWVFSNNLIKISDNAKSGDIAVIFSKNKGNIIGLGLYDEDSPIRIKVLHSNQKEKVSINKQYFEIKIKEAYRLRTPLLKTKTNSYRLLYGENDNFPGLIADVYAEVLVIKLYSTIWLPFLNDITEILSKIPNVKTIVLRLNRGLKNLKINELEDGKVIYGDLKNEVVTFYEHNVKFSANVIYGHKTGYFLDHRNNRFKVGELSKNKTVLDVFSYAGGFSVHALAKGATEVTSLDISKHALELAKFNGQLNSYEGKHNVICGDAFSVLKDLIDTKKTFDIVVIDPPSFAKQKSEIELAKKQYSRLAKLGINLVNPGGLLVLASCSSRVQSQSFFDINHQALSNSLRSFQLLEKTYHDIDHPVTFTEGAYLKCGYYRILD